MEASELKRVMENTPYWPIFPWLPMSRGHYAMMMCKRCGKDLPHPTSKEVRTLICRGCRIEAQDDLRLVIRRRATIKTQERLKTNVQERPQNNTNKENL